jgi:glycosyltransferase involved in cell wall biosynthesis
LATTQLAPSNLSAMNIQKPNITAIICTYRRPKLLRRAIESILNQTYQDFQICVYDNASGDETAAVVAEFAEKDSRIKYHCHPENIGLLKNYSYAMQQVNTPFFSFLADDDVVLPNFYTVALAGFEQAPTAFFSATSFLCLSIQGNKAGGGKFPSKFFAAPDGVFEFIESNVNPNLHGTLIRKDVLSICDEFNTTYFWADLEFLYRIAAAHPVVLCSEECLIFTIHNMDKGRKIVIDHAWLEPQTIAASLKPILSTESYSKLDGIFQKKIQSALYFLSIELIYDSDFASAKIGADKLRSEYGLYGQSFILETLILVFKLFPFALKFLRSVRDIRPYLKGQQEEFPTLSYAQIMDIYRNKKY